LHQADPRQRTGLEHQHTARAKHIGITGTFLRPRRHGGSERAGHAGDRAESSSKNK
jgi:hypothetical protein